MLYITVIIILAIIAHSNGLNVPLETKECSALNHISKAEFVEIHKYSKNEIVEHVKRFARLSGISIYTVKKCLRLNSVDGCRMS